MTLPRRDFDRDSFDAYSITSETEPRAIDDQRGTVPLVRLQMGTWRHLVCVCVRVYVCVSPDV